MVWRTGPVNLEGGRFAGTFFAITTDGELLCIDPSQVIDVEVLAVISGPDLGPDPNDLEAVYQIDSAEFAGTFFADQTITFLNGNKARMTSFAGDQVTVTLRPQDSDW